MRGDAGLKTGAPIPLHCSAMRGTSDGSFAPLCGTMPDLKTGVSMGFENVPLLGFENVPLFRGDWVPAEGWVDGIWRGCGRIGGGG